jgi:glutaryl-CoA dehydrogenase
VREHGLGSTSEADVEPPSEVRDLAQQLQGQPGFRAEKIEDKMALRVVQNALIDLQDVRVPRRTDRRTRVVHGRRGGAADDAGRGGMDGGRLCLGAYENALAYVRERQQFGRPIAASSSSRIRLVRMLGGITAARMLCARLSQLQDEGRATDAQASLAKALCTDARVGRLRP